MAAEQTSVRIATNATDQQLLDTLKKQPNIQKLVLADCGQITDNNLKYVANLDKELKELDLTNCNIGMAGLDHVKAIKTLEKLYIKGCTRIPDAYIEEFCRTLNSCTVFDETGGWTWTRYQRSRQETAEHYARGGLPGWGH